MNESRFTFFWLYVIDLHNHHSIGDVRHAVNPTSPFRMQMILESAIANAKTEEKKLKMKKNPARLILPP